MFSIFLLFTLAHCIEASQPTVISAIKSEKDVIFQGMKSDYIVYEVDFDQEIYFAENSPCTCIDSCTDKQEANELEVDAVTLDIGEWTESIINGDSVLFRFYFPKVLGCKSVMISLGNHWGETTGYIGVGRVPSPGDYDYIKYAKARDNIRVCPSEAGWNWGWWYILAIRNEPYDGNHFQVSWNVVDVSECTGEVQVEQDTLINNVGYYGIAEFYIFQYFRFPLDGCKNVSISVKQTTMDFGDIDLYASFTNTHPNLDFHDYSSQGNGNDAITLINVCEHQGYIYIGLYTWQGDDVPFVLTATTDTGFLLRPVVELPAQQFLYTFVYGQATLECEDEREVRCEFYAYAGCLDPYDVWNCCARFGFLPPLKESNVWVVTPSAASGGGYKGLPWWNVELPTIQDNISKRLTFTQYLSKESATVGRVYTKDNKCSVRFNNMLTNSQGEVLPDRVFFEDNKSDCEVNPKVDEILGKMKNETDLEMLKIYDILLSAESNTNGMIGCRNLLRSYTITGDYTSDWDSKSCYEYGQDYYSDPCCSHNLTIKECCTSHIIPIPRIKELKVRKDFTLGDCAMRTIEDYIQDTSTVKECIDEWHSAVGSVNTITDFVYDCATKLFGDFELIGAYCEDNDDCHYGASCYLGRCSHTSGDLKTCWWENANSIVLKSLYNYWKLDTAITQEIFNGKVDDYVRPMCIGPGSSGFRSHYSYLLTLPTCIDECVRNNITINCYDLSCNKDNICPPGSATNCYRYFQYFNGDDNSHCENNITLEGCYDCSESMKNNGTCVYLPWTREQCQQGYCVNYPNIHDRELCKEMGVCSSGEQECTTEYKGLVNLKNHLYPLDEGCYKEFVADFYGSATCDNDYTDNPWGCLDRNIRREDCNGRWLTTTPPVEDYACWDGTFYNYQSQQSCECSGNEWVQMFPLINSTWYPGRVIDTVWNPNAIKRTVNDTVDIMAFQRDIKQAINSIVSLSYYKSAACRSSNVEVFKSLVCVVNNNTGCFNSSGIASEKEWVCPFIDTNITGATFTVSSPSTFVPLEDYCQMLEINTIPITSYKTRVQSRLSSQSFTEKAPNSWSILYDHEFIITGQVVTDSIDVHWTFIAQDSVQICLERRGVEESPLFDVYQIAVIINDTISIYSDCEVIRDYLCFRTNTTGRYIGVKTRESTYNSIYVQSICSAIVYLLLSLVVPYQLFNVYYSEVPRKVQKFLTSLLVLIFLYVRATYFIMYSVGKVDSSINYVLFEFPIFIFMILNAIIIIIWFEIANTLKKLHPSKEFRNKLLFIFTAFIVYVVVSFAVFIATFYVYSDEEPQECSMIREIRKSDTSININKAYVVFVVGTCFSLIILMTIAGYKFLKPYLTKELKHKKGVLRLFILSWMLMSTFGISFTTKSVLMLFSVFDDLTIPILVFSILEYMPVATVLYYIDPPLSKQFLKLTTSKGSNGSKKSSNGSKKSSKKESSS